mmetsp:Transcript_7223/g.22017  ORF Transcript_7223/g.22017 Transcript_7223/m.22017 type:complete len:147 (+) Transcript_7223:63-503(+)|eukprot:CAMPEP_0198726078 /NCGR_PEP_ID=MMETSP1475-20131203/3251_1 /TAXON_ID= ORGANISM="Unidentified sp., Strain CCMP1999" /NCGR_SAMPLE_ID=MMETSP1475 /ASSEMBLY_ACC=CAM_ASM_001111 /LENGTH=146 /DNA_ID=CAMNT_0044487963 /DNA_START=71 /DNA_END=511 /DNA_ORIENTATION=+
MAFIGSVGALKASGKKPTRNQVKMQASPASPDNEKLTIMREKLEKSFQTVLTPDETTGKSGECDCIFCGGTGQRKCSWCKGCGTRQEMLDLSWSEMTRMFDEMKKTGKGMDKMEQVPVVCSACKGTTMLRCGFCRGDGKGSYGFAH